MAERGLEILVGGGVLLLALFSLIFAINQRTTHSDGAYTLYGEFTDASGIGPGTVVEIAGVPIGEVIGVELNEALFAKVAMRIDGTVQIPEDSELAWRQSDLIGSPRLSVLVFDMFAPPLGDGDFFSSVDPADNFFELLSSLASQAGTDG